MNKREETPGRIKLPGGLELTYGSDGTEYKPTDAYNAANHGVLAMVKDWVTKHPDLVNAPKSAQEPDTLLHLAAWGGHVDIIEFLLDHGADIAARGEYDLTPLHYAAEYEQVAAIETLVKRGARVDATTGYGATPLSWAASRGLRDRPTVDALLRHGANIHAKDTAGLTVMQRAGLGSAVAVAEVLHEHGVEFDLHSAMLLGNGGAIRKILKDPNAVKNAAEPHRLIEQAVSMILYTLWDRDLKRRGADRTAVKQIMVDNLDILESLWAQNAPMDRSLSALHTALQFPDPLIAEVLLKHGARLDDGHCKPMDLLSLAQMNIHCAPEMMALLARYGVTDSGKAPAETPEATLDLCKAIKSDNAMVRFMAITSLGAYGWRARAAVPDLLQALKDKDENIRASAAQSLKMIDPAAAAKAGIK